MANQQTETTTTNASAATAGTNASVATAEQTPIEQTQDQVFSDALGSALSESEPTGSVTDEPQSKPADQQSTEQPTGTDTPADKPADTPADKPADKPTELPTASTGDKPTGETTSPEDAKSVTTEKPAPVDAKSVAQAVVEALKTDKQAQTSEKQPEKELTLDDFVAAEDKEFLANHDKEWSEVSRASGIHIRAHVELAKHQMVNQFARVLAPIVNELNELRVTRALDSIRTAHPDYEQLAPQVTEWVNSMDEIYRPALQKVMQSGTATEVIKLYDAFKKTRASTTAVPAEPASSATQVTTTQTPTPVVVKAPSKEAVAATAAVTSQRTSSPMKDVNDFDGALAEALKQ